MTQLPTATDITKSQRYVNICLWCEDLKEKSPCGKILSCCSIYKRKGVLILEIDQRRRKTIFLTFLKICIGSVSEIEIVDSSDLFFSFKCWKGKISIEKPTKKRSLFGFKFLSVFVGVDWKLIAWQSISLELLSDLNAVKICPKLNYVSGCENLRLLFQFWWKFQFRIIKISDYISLSFKRRSWYWFSKVLVKNQLRLGAF